MNGGPLQQLLYCWTNQRNQKEFWYEIEGYIMKVESLETKALNQTISQAFYMSSITKKIFTECRKPGNQKVRKIEKEDHQMRTLLKEVILAIWEKNNIFIMSENLYV